MAKNDASGELLHGAVDASKIALSGHSLGAYPAYALAGGDDQVCDALVDAHYWGDPLPYAQFACVSTPSDPRIRAIVSLDGASWDMRYHELARISVPSLILGETVEHLASYNWFPDPGAGLNHARVHAAINRNDSYRVDITTANHMSFTNWCDGLQLLSRRGVTTVGGVALSDPLSYSAGCVAKSTFSPANDPATRQIVTTYMVAFLNTQFGRADEAWMLTSDYAARSQPQVEFFDLETCSASVPGPTYYTYRPHAGQCQVAEKDPLGYFVLTGSASPSVPGFQILDRGYVVAGTWAGYASPVGVSSSALGAGTTTITPADFSAVAAGATELCAQGSIGGATDSAGAALIGTNLSQAPSVSDAGAYDAGTDAAIDGGNPPVQLVHTGGTGLIVKYSNPGGTVIGIQLARGDGTSPTDRACANLSGLGGTELVPWTAFRNGHACWGSGSMSPTVGTQISRVSLYVPGDVTPVSYNFCLQGIGQAP